MTIRIESLIHAAELARAASDALTIASCGVTPTRRLILQSEAEAALYGAIDLIWQAGSETFAKRIAALSAEIVEFERNTKEAA